MAVTKIHPIATTLNKSIDYIINPDKTNGKILVSSFACSAETAAVEFEWTKKNSEQQGGRLAYHLIQSFDIGEVDYDTAHEIGKKFADGVLKGKYEYVIATHIDKGHCHNHIIFNSVSFADKKKFHGASNIFHRIQRESDRLCHEYGLSVVDQTKNKGKSYSEYTANKEGTSWKSLLRKRIDECILCSKDWDIFLSLMGKNYEIKQGKYISFKAEGQERFIRSKTLGAEYSEERIKERLQGITHTVSNAQNSKNPFKLIIDIENNIKAQQSAGFAHWAKIQNLKTAAETMNYITEKGILDYSVLTEKYESVKYKKDNAHSRIKAIEKRIKELDILIKDIKIYRKTKPVVDRVEKIVFKEKYRKEHESEFILFKAAAQSLKPHLKDGKPPLIKPVRTEINQLISEKNSLYSEYDLLKKEFAEVQKIKRNVDMILGKDHSPKRENIRRRDDGLE